jgi:2-methylaconitate cis-trans-isomerase PrpF
MNARLAAFCRKFSQACYNENLKNTTDFLDILIKIQFFSPHTIHVMLFCCGEMAAAAAAAVTAAAATIVAHLCGRNLWFLDGTLILSSLSQSLFSCQSG